MANVGLHVPDFQDFQGQLAMRVGSVLIRKRQLFIPHVTLRSVDVVVCLRNRCHMGEKHR